MQFIKKNYEKVLLGVVLFGLVVISVFLLLMVANEKQGQEERRNKIINLPPRPLPPPDLGPAEAFIKQAATAKTLNFSDTAHKLFNPQRWQKTVAGAVIKSPVGTEVQKIEIAKITELYFTIGLESVNVVPETGARYSISVEDQAAAKPGSRGRRSRWASKGDKIEYGDNKESFLVKDVQGAPDNPAAVILELNDPEQTVPISLNKPYRRVAGYMASLKYSPENRQFPNKRVSEKIFVAGEEYTIVTVTENEVFLQGKNQKKWTIKYNAAP